MTSDREPGELGQARAHADILRAIVDGGESRAILQLLVARLGPLLGARQCLVVLLDRHQRALITAAVGIANPDPEVTFKHDRDGIGYTAMTERRVVVSADVLDDPEIVLSPSTRKFIEREGYRSGLALPLLADTRVLGVLVAGWPEVGAVSPAHVAIAQPFADLAVMVLERARLSSQAADRSLLDDALADIERQLLAELSLDRLLPSIIEHARRLVDAHGSIYLAELDRRWLRQGWTSWPRPLGGLAYGEGLVGECAKSRRGLIVNDYPSWPGAHAPAVALGMRHVMAQPLMSVGRVLGVIVMGRADPAPGFEPRDLDLLDRFATQAAIALRNATVYAEAEQRRRGAEALARMARALSEAPDLGALGERIAASVGSLFGLPCSVHLLQTDGSLAELAAAGADAGHAPAVDAAATARIIDDGKADVVPDALVVPLRAEGRVIGLIEIGAVGGREFSSLDVELAQAFADQSAPALAGARLHATLRTSELRTGRVIDTALDAVVSIDADGRIIGWNARAEEMFGWRREDAAGRVLAETIVPPRYRAAHEEGLRRYRVARAGPVVNRRLELSALRRDGSEFPVELSISPVAVDGVTTFTAFVRDITARRNAEEAIRRQTALVRLLLAVAAAANEAPTAHAALTIGVDEVCTYTGWPVGDAFVPADDGSGDLVAAHIWHVGDDPERYRAFRELTEVSRFASGVGLPGRVAATGAAAWIMDLARDDNFPRLRAAAASGLRSAFGFPVTVGGEVVAVLEFFTGDRREPDAALLEAMANIGTQLGRVFERERAEAGLRLAKDAAEAASRAKSAFLANMSHALRTPLNAILGYAQVLGRDADLDALRRRAVGIIEGSGEHLLSLINEVLDLAKIEAGTIEVSQAPVDLSALITGVADLMRARAEDKGLAFACECPAVLPAAVRADDKRLRQVLANLLDNGVKYTVRGHVTLTVARDGDRYRFAVEDTGVGISAEQLPRIFESFHQVRTASEFIEGTGLGLAISKTLVRLMGGALRVESTPGEGSRFWFELELPEVDAPMPVAVPTRRLVGVRGSRRRVLVVDDKPDNRRLLVDLLVPLGFEVTEAPDAAACLARVAADPPDAVLLDLRMPGMSGLEATRRLRTLEGGARLVVIAISASVFGHHRDQCIAAGADEFLAKPFRLDRLVALLCPRLGLEPAYDGEPEEPVASPPDAGPLVFPPPDVLAPLLEQARRGNVRSVLDRAAQLEADDARFVAFVRELRGLARSFQVKKLCQFLEEGHPVG